MEPEGSLPCSQHPTTGPYPEPDQSNQYRPILGRAKICLHSVQTGSGVHPVLGTGGDFSGGKMARAWSWPLTSI
jgi:hypothetical protein